MAGLLKNISTYSLGGILNRSVQFLLLPVYTRWLDPADYGKLELIYMILAILNITNGLLIQNGYARIYFDYRENREKLRLYGSAVFFVFLTGLVIVGVGFIFSGTISKQFLNFENDDYILKLVLVSAFLKSLSLVQYKNLVIKQQAKPFISIHFTYVTLTLLLTVLFVVVLGMKIEGILYSQIIGGSAQLLILSLKTFRRDMLMVSRKFIAQMLAFSVFMLLPSISAFVLNMTNRYFLAEFRDYEEVGIFSLGARLATVIPLLFTEPVKKAFGPHIYSMVDNEARCKAEMKRFLNLFFIGIVTLGLCLSLFSKEMVMVIASSEFSGSHVIVPLLSLSYILYGTAGIAVLAIHITKKTWIITIVFLVSSLVSLGMNFLLIPRFGKIGASVAHNISVAVILAGYFIAIAKHYPIKFPLLKYLLILLLAAALYLAALQVDLHLVIMVLIKAALVVLFTFLVFRMGLNVEEQQKIRELISSKIKIPKIKSS